MWGNRLCFNLKPARHHVRFRSLGLQLLLLSQESERGLFFPKICIRTFARYTVAMENPLCYKSQSSV